MSKQHPRSKQSHAAAFCVVQGAVVSGRDPFVSLLELQTASGLVHDLLKTCEMPDGWFVCCADGVTRVPNVAPPRQHKPATLRRTRSRPKIRAKRIALTLYGQVVPP